ncbi:hypothetical protein JZX82_gp49 [Gordonia phage William]|uniref:Uncharacterized protein n=1 Tax=Gordonia phage William TaxID=2571253 RepID=A0A4Y6EQ52_9CAUD|nr:hypothetical protein JZX82_gp49 [Gordonia phage William]QDF17144.1 hypothetical protein SEA_WILLIAM_49 [Gordonia phage William]
MNPDVLELIRAICAQDPRITVLMTVAPNPDGGHFTAVTVVGLPADQFPEYRTGDYDSDHMLTVGTFDQRDEGSTLSVTRYHDDDFVAALQTARDYISAAVTQ